MYQTMQRAVTLARRTRGPRLEALLAGSLLHLEDGDFALPLSQSACLPLLESLGFEAAMPQPDRNLLLLGAGASLVLKEAGDERFALVIVRSGQASKAEPAWAEALRYAAKAQLPLLAVCIAPDRQ